MRINGINSSEKLSNIYKKNKVSGISKNIGIEKSGDRLEISNIAKEISLIDDPVIDEARIIDNIQNLIENENYQVDSKKLAMAMLRCVKEREE